MSGDEPEDGIFERMLKAGPQLDDDGDGIRMMVGAVPSDALQRARLEWERMSRFITTAYDAMCNLDDHVLRVYQDRLRRLAQDLELLLGLAPLDETQRANLLALVLSYDDDDDGGDDELEPADAPPGETVDA